MMSHINCFLTLGALTCPLPASLPSDSNPQPCPSSLPRICTPEFRRAGQDCASGAQEAEGQALSLTELSRVSIRCNGLQAEHRLLSTAGAASLRLFCSQRFQRELDGDRSLLIPIATPERIMMLPPFVFKPSSHSLEFLSPRCHWAPLKAQCSCRSALL